jgi:hypothetical protein
VLNALFVGDSDNDVLPYPDQVITKSAVGAPKKQDKFVILTSGQAYAAKLEYQKEKLKKKNEKEERQRKRLMKRQDHNLKKTAKNELTQTSKRTSEKQITPVENTLHVSRKRQVGL